MGVAVDQWRREDLHVELRLWREEEAVMLGIHVAQREIECVCVVEEEEAVINT